jgi:hypothetical protein
MITICDNKAKINNSDIPMYLTSITLGAVAKKTIVNVPIISARNIFWLDVSQLFS